MKGEDTSGQHPDRRHQIISIAEVVVEAAPDDRDNVLDDLCGDDTYLRREVKLLIEAADSIDSRASTRGTSNTPGTGARIDRYRLLQRIGEGGFGEVWMAEQLEPVQRRVAVKLIKPGMDTGQVIARFEAERQALALMDHPNIARVFDAGTTPQGRPYFVMELVKGVPITEYCRKAKLDVRGRVELMRQVCSAVQHAHHKGVIHRDIKPGNVLVGDMDGEPVPKVIDFGVAKALERPLTDKTLFTEFRQFLGTPEYMSPEQADLSMMDVDTRSDVYALGVLLYELLVGAPPFDPTSLRSVGFDEMRRIIKEQDPPSLVEQLNRSRSRSAHSGRPREVPFSPEKLSRLVRGELDWIVQRAMAKERDRRYPSASDFSEDLGRYLGGEPVAAGPPSLRYRSGRYLRRHRTGVTIAAGLFVVVLGYLALVLWDNAQIRKAEALAVARANEAEAINEYINDTLMAVRPSMEAGKGREVTMLDWLNVASRDVDVKFKDQPAVEANIQTTLGYTYLELGAYKEAKKHLDRARQLSEMLYGKKNPQTLTTIDGLTMVDMSLDDLDAAEAKLRELLSIRRETLGKDALNTRKTEEGLAIVLKRRGKLEEAEQLYLDTLARKVEEGGERHRDVLLTKDNLAKLYLMWGRPRQAMEMAQEVVQLRRSQPKLDQAATIDSERALARCYVALGRYEEAEQLCLRIEGDQLKTFGPDHVKTFQLMQTLANVYLEEGRYEEAYPLLLETVDGFKRALSKDHVSTRRAEMTLALTLAVQGRHEESDGIARAAIESLKLSRGSRHQFTLNAKYNQALLYREQGRLADAEKLLRETLAKQETTIGLRHPDTLRSLAELSALCALQEHYVEAIELARRALAGYSTVIGSQHPMNGTLRQQLLGSLTKLGRLEEATELAERDRELNEAAFGSQDPRTQNAYRRLIEIYHRRAQIEPNGPWEARAAELSTRYPASIETDQQVGQTLTE